MAGDVKVAVVGGQLPVSDTGTADFTKGGFGTPKACIIILTKDITDDTSVNTESLVSIGFSDFTDDYCITHQDEDASAKVDCDALKSNTSCYTRISTSADVSVQGTADAITDGVRLTNTSGSGQPFATVIMFGGADLAISLQSSAINSSQDGTATVAHSGFTDGNDKLIFFIGSDISGEDSASSGINNSFGVCHATGSDSGGWTLVQRCMGWASDHAASVSAASATINTDQVLSMITEAGTQDWSLEVTALSNSGGTWTVTTRDNGAGAGMEVYSLALDLDDRKAKVGSVNAPTTGSTWTPSVSLGFTPQYVGLGTTLLSTENTINSSTLSGALGVSSNTGSGEETCHSWYNEDAVPDTNTNNLFRSRAVDLRNHSTGAVVFDFQHSSFNSGDWTYAINTVLVVTAKWFYWTIEEAAADTEDNLLADDVESASETSTPVIGQTHVITVVSAESASETSAPVVGQEHTLLSTSVESASEVSTPAVVEVTPLLADDVESASEVTTPVIGQGHTLAATSVESASETGTPAVGQEHVLLADDAESASEVSAPVVGQEHGLLSTSVESASEVSTPAVAESNVLLADDVESASEVSVPAVGQEHVFLADDVESASEVSAPTMAQIHALIAGSVECATEVSAPVLVDLGGDDILLADDVESASEVSMPGLGQEHILLALSAESASELSLPVLAEIGVLSGTRRQRQIKSLTRSRRRRR